LSLIAMVGGSFVAVLAFKQIHGLKEHPLPKGEILALWIHGLMFLFLAFLAIFGFIGALTKSRAKIATFAIAVAIHLGFSVASGIFTIISVFRHGAEEQVKQCIAAGGEASANATVDTAAGAASGVTEAACKSGVSIMKAAMIIIYVITWGVQLYCYFVVERYADQLAEEEERRGVVVMPPTQQVQQVASNAVSHAQNPPAPAYSAFAPSYPFSAPGAAFGNNGRAHDRV